jgi:hypothetical protein
MKRRTKAGPQIEKHKSFDQLCQMARSQSITKALDYHQATAEANNFALELDELLTLRIFPETYICDLKRSVLFYSSKHSVVK